MKKKEINYSIGAFVPEYRSIAVEMNEDSKGVAALNVQSCHLLELCNRDSKRNRTVFSLTHFTKKQLTYLEIIEKNLDVILKDFVAKGGNLEAVEIRIFGGDEEREHLRKNLKDSLEKKILGCKIVEPIGHYTVGKESIDYLFRPDGVTFCRAKMSEKDPLKDTLSKDLLRDNGEVNKEALERYNDAMSRAYSQVGFLYEIQVNNRHKEFDIVAKTLSLSAFSEAEYKKLKNEEKVELCNALETLTTKMHSVNPEKKKARNDDEKAGSGCIQR